MRAWRRSHDCSTLRHHKLARRFGGARATSALPRQAALDHAALNLRCRRTPGGATPFSASQAGENRQAVGAPPGAAVSCSSHFLSSFRGGRAQTSKRALARAEAIKSHHARHKADPHSGPLLRSWCCPPYGVLLQPLSWGLTNILRSAPAPHPAIGRHRLLPAKATFPSRRRQRGRPNCLLVQYNTARGRFASPPAAKPARRPPSRARPICAGTMLFSELYKSPRSTLSKLRHSHAAPLVLPGPLYDADLVSRDKARQKEAVRKYLADRIRGDWDFVWPPPQPQPQEQQEQQQQQQQQQQPPPPLPPPAPGGDPSAAPPADNGAASEVAVEDSDSDADSDGADSDADSQSVYSTVSDDPQRFRPRADWTSDWSDDDGRDPAPAPAPSPFRFDSPDSVGAVVQASTAARKAKRRRDERSEMAWNAGLACFNARRDAWTGARTVRVKPRPDTPPTSPPASPRRSLWRFHSHARSDPTAQSPTWPLSPVTSSNSRHSQHSAPEAASAASAATSPCDGDTSNTSDEAASLHHPHYPVETLVPIPAPLLPPANPMRASITPAIYLSLYDKVVGHSLQPSCPINLADMTRSCVAGWRRDGEWPPRAAEPAASAVVVVRKKKKDDRRAAATAKERRDSAATASSPGRRLSFGGLLGTTSADGEKEHDEAGAGKVLKRSIQRVLGLGHGHSSSVG